MSRTRAESRGPPPGTVDAEVDRESSPHANPAAIMLRLTKLTFLLAFTIAGYSVEYIRSFNAHTIVEAEASEAKRQRRKERRQGTWSHLLDGAGADAGPDPPPG